jgi:hypothetical protein
MEEKSLKLGLLVDLEEVMDKNKNEVEYENSFYY